MELGWDLSGNSTVFDEFGDVYRCAVLNHSHHMTILPNPTHEIDQGTLQHLADIDISSYRLRSDILPSLKSGLGKLQSNQR